MPGARAGREGGRRVARAASQRLRGVASRAKSRLRNHQKLTTAGTEERDRIMTHTLKIEGLHVSVDSKQILLRRRPDDPLRPDARVDGSERLGQEHAGAGHHGSSQLRGDGRDASNWTARTCLSMSPDERARAGIFYAFQRPVAIPGVKMADFLRHATTNVRNPQPQGR